MEFLTSVVDFAHKPHSNKNSEENCFADCSETAYMFWWVDIQTLTAYMFQILEKNVFMTHENHMIMIA